jgi:hypothetical protein
LHVNEKTLHGSENILHGNEQTLHGNEGTFESFSNFMQKLLISIDKPLKILHEIPKTLQRTQKFFVNF